MDEAGLAAPESSVRDRATGEPEEPLGDDDVDVRAEDPAEEPAAASETPGDEPEQPEPFDPADPADPAEPSELLESSDSPEPADPADTSEPSDEDAAPGTVEEGEAAAGGEEAGEGSSEEQAGEDAEAQDESAGAAEGAPAAEEADRSSGRGLLGRFKDAVAAVRGPDTPTEVQSVVDRPDFHNPQALNARPDRYGNPLEREDGTRVPLFDGAPRREQTHQGSIGDCGMISTMGAVAGHLPDTIRDAVRERDDGAYEVTLHETKYAALRGRYEPTGRPVRLTVTPELPVFSEEPGKAGFARTAEVGVAWPAILEKAIAGVDQTWDDERRAKWDRQHSQADAGTRGYVRLDDGSYGNERAEVLTQLTGRPSSVVEFPSGYDMQGRSADRQLIEDIRGKLADNCPVLVGTVSTKRSEAPLAKDLISGHAYEVTEVDDRGRFHLRNPHNINHPEELTVSEFKKYIKPSYVTLE
ncbi:C2 family cysteine protease [Streptomyces sp. NBC_00199]|uniref:C2 family cysteine protease n=1 Tax=Streptomyces sp. NBC_00199 TaxID=2975678 RepID=UPI00225560FE|nr:C2 family cysteine protease [Streptomyces sp. NBC_00199]MCX5266422.1 hypothetical protein [Streptomyces sp. NBC_00199]